MFLSKIVLLELSISASILFSTVKGEQLTDDELKFKSTDIQYRVLSDIKGDWNQQTEAWTGSILIMQFVKNSSYDGVEQIETCHSGIGLAVGHRCKNGGACAFLTEYLTPMSYERAEEFLRQEVRQGNIEYVFTACYCSFPRSGDTCENISPCATKMDWIEITHFALQEDVDDVVIADVATLDSCKEACIMRSDFTCKSLDYSHNFSKCYLFDRTRNANPDKFTVDIPYSYYEPQRSSYCGKFGECIITPSSPYYTCECSAGYTGVMCDTPVSGCTAHPCRHNGTCHDTLGGYICMCVVGWTGRDCEAVLDYCVTHKPCANGGTCYSEEASSSSTPFTCACVMAWSGPTCNVTWEMHKARVIREEMDDDNTLLLQAEELLWMEHVQTYWPMYMAVGGIAMLVTGPLLIAIVWGRTRQLQEDRDKKLIEQVRHMRNRRRRDQRSKGKK